MTEENTIDVIGVKLYNKDIPSAIKQIEQAILSMESPESRCISATGAHGMVYARSHRFFKDLLNGFYLNLPDGMPGVWVGKLKGASGMKRCYGPDFFAEMLKSTSGKDITHFLCGGMEGVADQLKDVCAAKFNNPNVVGTFSPPFKNIDEYDYASIAAMINRSGADIVWVGIGTPKQEQFMYELSKHTQVHFLVTVGAAFDFHIGNVKQAPAWVQKIGMEWFFRLCMEPGRLYKRYLEVVPKFIWYSGVDLIRHYVNKR